MNGQRSLRLFPCFLLIVLIMALSGWSQVARAQTLQITMTPSLTPAFDPNITDYAIGPGGVAYVQVSGNAPNNTSVSVDGQPYSTGAFNTQVNNLSAGQKFSFVVNTAGVLKTYYVRRTPSDFPGWTTERPGTPQSEFYVFAPDIKTDFGALRNYVIVADNHGVPIWWYRTSYCPIDAKILPGGQVGWLSFAVNPAHAEVRTFNGTLVHSLGAAAPIGGNVDNHELLQLPNGNVLFIVGVVRGPVDLSAFGGSKTANVLDNVIEEIAPNGSLVWSWSSMDHIPISETGQGWWTTYLVNSNPADPFHMNSVEADMGCRLASGGGGPGYLISLRHLNAVIRIDKTTGARTMKLGGSPRPESLTFVGDTFGNFSGNHDARIVYDGTLSLHDNGTLAGRAPRAVRYRINPITHTATLVEQVTDARAPASGCCGSARKLITGNWVMEWGDSPFLTELAPNGSLVFRMNYSDPFFAYRGTPVPFGQVNRADLRNGMDVMFPR